MDYTSVWVQFVSSFLELFKFRPFSSHVRKHIILILRMYVILVLYKRTVECIDPILLWRPYLNNRNYMYTPHPKTGFIIVINRVFLFTANIKISIMKQVIPTTVIPRVSQTINNLNCLKYRFDIFTHDCK